MSYLERDGQGRHLSSLRVDNIQLGDSGEYSCQPAVGPQAAVLVHVLNRDTVVQAVLGEGEGVVRGTQRSRLFSGKVRG